MISLGLLFILTQSALALTGYCGPSTPEHQVSASRQSTVPRASLASTLRLASSSGFTACPPAQSQRVTSTTSALTGGTPTSLTPARQHCSYSIWTAVQYAASSTGIHLQPVCVR